MRFRIGLSLTMMAVMGASFALAQTTSRPAPAAAAPAGGAPGYSTDLLASGCRDPDFVAAVVPFDNVTRQAFAFHAPDLSAERQEFAKRFTNGDLKAADLELNKYSNYYEQEFYKVVQPGELKLNDILNRGEIAESTYKTATGFARAWENLVIDNLRVIYNADQFFEARRKAGPLEKQDAGEAYGLKIAYIKLMGQMKAGNYAELWKQGLLKFCGKFSANATFGDTRVRVVGCGVFHPDASWQKEAADMKGADVNMCHIPVKCMATYTTPKTGQTGGVQELPDSHFFAVSCPRTSCSDMKACVQAESSAAGTVPAQRYVPGKAVQ